jgi:predicted acyl esterase
MLFGRLLAERGFQAVVQSCRGTYGSGGVLTRSATSEPTLCPL